MTAPVPPGVGGQRRLLAILTGDQGRGKTTACRELISLARERGLACAGILSPARLAAGTKVGIDVLDVRSGESRPLAEIEPGSCGPVPGAWDPGAAVFIDLAPGRLRLGPHRFNEGAIAWARDRLAEACPCDLLVVDEIGPLEVEQGRGWANALAVLANGDYRRAVVVVRPGLVEAVRVTLEDSVAVALVTEAPVSGSAGPRLPAALIEFIASVRS